MRALLWAAVVLAIGCSSVPERSGDVSAAGAGGSDAQAGTWTASATAGEGSAVGGAPDDAGGQGGAQAASMSGDNAGHSGSPASGNGGAAGSLVSSGGTAATNGGGASGATAGGTGGAAAGSDSAGEPSALGGAGGETGGAGGDGAADPCAGVKHWDPNERWTDYTRGDERVFGGVLYQCGAPQGCNTYPDHVAAPPDNPEDGWLLVAACEGGPVAEVAACQCQTGDCCDGCYLRPASHFCGAQVSGSQCYKNAVFRDYSNLFCDGIAANECLRWGSQIVKSTGPDPCPSQTTCVEAGDQASCVPQ